MTNKADDQSTTIKYMRDLQKLSFRQISKLTNIPRKRCSKIYSKESGSTGIKRVNVGLLEGHRSLIASWYHQQPDIKVTQIYDRLIQRGIEISYPSVTLFTKGMRPQKKVRTYFPLHFIPAEEGQVDWFFIDHPKLGRISGFAMILSYSRFLYAEMFQRHSFEFFIQGHLNAFESFKGLPHHLRYDNLKSVVLQVKPQQLNPAFMEFAYQYKFAIRVCNPASGNEKGRVERVIRTMKESFFNIRREDHSLDAINLGLKAWVHKKNHSIHRTTGLLPISLINEEKLLPIPHAPWHNVMIHEPKTVSKTAEITFDTNRYSVPEAWVGKSVILHSTPTELKIYDLKSHHIATHLREFKKNQSLINPKHREFKPLSIIAKKDRTTHMIRNLGSEFELFLNESEKNDDTQYVAEQLSELVKHHSKAMVQSAIRELVESKNVHINALIRLLNTPPNDQEPVYPNNPELLAFEYKRRPLTDYENKVKNER